MGENEDDAMCCFPPWERSRKGGKGCNGKAARVKSGGLDEDVAPWSGGSSISAKLT
jgi:hypothetical protein